MSEKEKLVELAGKPLGSRILGYFKLSGPGYMQSAMTLGGGSIASCVLMGSLLGYQLLWVQPLAIFLGFCVLGAVAKQTCETGEKPYEAFWNRLHPAMAIAWGIAALVATILWHIPQYSLTANGAVELLNGVGLDLSSIVGRGAIGVMVLCAAGFVCYLYSTGAKGLKIYEGLVKILVWGIVVAFAVATFATGIDFKEFFLGITGISFIQHISEFGFPETAIKPIVGGIAAAVGINMVFLYPYSLLNKNWGKEHRELAYFDLISGMVVPFLFATAFMMIAVANTIGPEPGTLGVAVRDIRGILPALGVVLGANGALLVIGLGMFAIGFSTIITHMLASGFIGCELFGFAYQGKAKFWFSLLPAVGIVGVLIPFPWYAAVTASTLALPLMPVAVIGFLILLNSKSYMGDARPEGGARLFWNISLCAAILIMVVSGFFGIQKNWSQLKEQFSDVPAVEAPAEEPEAPEAPAESEETAALLLTPAPVAEVGGPPLEKQEVSRNLMGTRFEITMYAPTGAYNRSRLTEIGLAALDRVEELERRISTWRIDSFTAKINRMAAKEPVKVHPDVMALLKVSQQAYDETGGIFDVTVGPLLDLWGVYKKEHRIPTDDEITTTLQRVGLDKVQIDYDQRTVFFTQTGMRLDFGGIGKGYALDVAARVLKGNGIENALLSGGDSTFVALGAPPETPGWNIIVDKIYQDADDYVDRIVIKDEAFSTSSGEGRTFEVDDQRFLHIYDARTGAAVDETLGAMAITPTGAQSDALSTTFLVMNEDEVQEFCNAHPEVKAIKVGLVEGKPQSVRINFPAA